MFKPHAFRAPACFRIPVALAVLCLGLGVGARGATPRNIVVIIADDLGYGDLGCYHQNARAPGLPRIRTPNLDRMAQEGLRFTHHYAGAPVCVSSRCTLVTGRNQGHAWIRDEIFDGVFPATMPSLGSLLSQAGYYNGLVGKWGMSGTYPGTDRYNPPGHPLYRGFSEYYGFLRHADQLSYYPDNNGTLVDGFQPVTNGLQNAYVTDLFTARAKKFITDHRQARPQQPFFLYLGQIAPHTYMHAPANPYPAGGGLGGGVQWPLDTTGAVPHSYLGPDYQNATYDHDQNAATAPVAWPLIEKRFASMVTRLDDSVGDLLQTLRDLNIHTNTLVVFTSDQGPQNDLDSDNVSRQDPRFFESWGPLDGTKNDFLEGGLRVPAIVWAPGLVATGRVSALPSTFCDWMPTFAELSGQPAPAWSDGVSLLPTLTGQGVQRQRPYLYSEFRATSMKPVEYEIAARKGVPSFIGQSQWIREGDLVGVRFGMTGLSDPLRLYNVVADPFQVSNLAANPDYAAVLERMQRRLSSSRTPNPFSPRPYDYAQFPARGAGGANGLRWRAHLGSWPWLPDLAGFTPVSTGVVASVNLSVRPRDDDFGLEFEGLLSAPVSGSYSFRLTADLGASLWIDGANLIAEDRASFGSRVATLALEAGAHDFRLMMRHGTGARQLSLEWLPPGGVYEVIPAARFHLDLDSGDYPRMAEDEVVVARNASVQVRPLDNDFLGPNPASFQLSHGPVPAGSASQSGSLITYQPPTGFLGTVWIPYEVNAGARSGTSRIRVDVVHDAPELWLPLNEATGSTVHDAGGRPVGGVEGTDGGPSPWQPGKSGSALRLDGVNDGVLVTGYTPPLGTTARTVSAWVRPTGAGPIVAWGQPFNQQKFYLVVENSPANSAVGQLRVEVGGGFLRGTTNLRDGLWHHVAVTFANDGTPDAADCLLYVDGVQESLTLVQANPFSTVSGPLEIGADQHGRHLPGDIDEVRIHPRALSPSEVVELASRTDDVWRAWQRRYFGEATATPSADSDGDGAADLHEFAMGGQANLADSPPRASGLPVANAFRLLARRRVGAGVTYQVEQSTNLVAWVAAAPVVGSATPDPDDPAFEWLTHDLPSTEPLLYLRLRMFAPP